ncbi:hypothetical protein VMCG_03715 [Cytospora schulzeri]|uniref:Uncharacterized protein n=1 Tax=Cytospora schulzeri TaxID=448051 RepID=A0A423WUG5_9PEZI|nr:hypothetical protein VMCG_03715 [Valsa malicola]
MQPRKSNNPSTLPPESVLAALFFPAGSQHTPTGKSAEKNKETEGEEEVRKAVLKVEDWTDDDDFIPNIN